MRAPSRSIWNVSPCFQPAANVITCTAETGVGESVSSKSYCGTVVNTIGSEYSVPNSGKTNRGG